MAFGRSTRQPTVGFFTLVRLWRWTKVLLSFRQPSDDPCGDPRVVSAGKRQNGLYYRNCKKASDLRRMAE